MLNETVKFNKNIKPACLPSVEYPIQPSDNLILYGFGGKNRTQDSSEVLMKARMKVIARPNETYIPEYSNGENYENIDVTGYFNNSDACGGDSGSPLIRQHPYYKPCLTEVMALVSYGQFCDAKASQTVYTNVLHYLPWIHQVLWNVSETPKKPPPKPFFKILTL